MLIYSICMKREDADRHLNSAKDLPIHMPLYDNILFLKKNRNGALKRIMRLRSIQK